MESHTITALFRFGEDLYRPWYRYVLRKGSSCDSLGVRKSELDENTIVVIKPDILDFETYEFDFRDPFWYHNVCDVLKIEPYKSEWTIANYTLEALSRIMNDEESPHKEEAASIYEEIKSVVEGTNEKWS